MKIGIDKNQLTTDINEEIAKLDRADKSSQKVALSYASKIASDVRGVVIPRITKKYKASTHNTVNLKISSSGFTKGSKNRKRIGFKLKNVTNNWKRAVLTSYPLNLYENDTKVYTKRNPYIRETYNTPITYKRKGTHILADVSSQLGTIAKHSEAEFLEQIRYAIEEGK